MLLLANITYFDTKSLEKSKQSMEKVNNNKGTFYTNADIFLTKRKIENWQIYGQAYISIL